MVAIPRLPNGPPKVRIFRLLSAAVWLLLLTAHLSACASGAPGRAKDRFGADVPNAVDSTVTSSRASATAAPEAAPAVDMPAARPAVTDSSAPALARAGTIPEPQSGTPPNPVAELIAEADRLAGSGRMGDAAAVLERALRIEPGNPAILQRLAVVRMRQQRYDQAEALAMRSNALSANDHAVLARNWRIISEARRLRGDARGAQQAMDQARRFELRSWARDKPAE
ncbi:MAG: tetratricopeptide repeat protein [Chromatiales bacterium]|nr:tetratricopeptide repeat protein [Chromatiales bacterium]